MTGSFQSQNIILGVTGSIAAYKTPQLVRRLRDGGAVVRVVMTQAASRFVGAVSLQAVSGLPVRTDLWDPEAEAAMDHIDLARWADQLLIAPATAHVIARLAYGFADDLLGTLCLATNARLSLAPAMNQAMWRHPAVRANVETLVARGARILGPGNGDQACGDVGPGRMLEPDEIAAAVLTAATNGGTGILQGLKVMITAGPTREPIDPVRYITNRSSGKMGFALAEAAVEAGAEVTLVAGPVALSTPKGVRRLDVETAEQMHSAVHQDIADADIFIGCAAVSDYRSETVAAEKIKRNADSFSLDLVKSKDTLATVAARPDAPFTVGFAAETCDVAGHALEKLERKGVDMIAANEVGPARGFDKETNAVDVFWRGGRESIGMDTKQNVARGLMRLIAKRYSDKTTAALESEAASQ